MVVQILLHDLFVGVLVVDLVYLQLLLVLKGLLFDPHHHLLFKEFPHFSLVAVFLIVALSQVDQGLHGAVQVLASKGRHALLSFLGPPVVRANHLFLDCIEALQLCVYLSHCFKLFELILLKLQSLLLHNSFLLAVLCLLEFQFKSAPGLRGRRLL